MPPDLVAKFQAIDIAEVILWLDLRLRVVYQQEIRAERPSLYEIICLPLNPMDCELSCFLL
jgi:hypothetical protein